jgi:hypothetical protein
VNAALQVPTLEIAAIAAGESAGAEAADGRALPIAVVNIVQFRFVAARIGGRLPDRDAPGDWRNFVLGLHGGKAEEQRKRQK